MRSHTACRRVGTHHARCTATSTRAAAASSAQQVHAWRGAFAGRAAATRATTQAGQASRDRSVYVGAAGRAACCYFHELWRAFGGERREKRLACAEEGWGVHACALRWAVDGPMCVCTCRYLQQFKPWTLNAAVSSRQAAHC